MPSLQIFECGACRQHAPGLSARPDGLPALGRLDTLPWRHGGGLSRRPGADSCCGYAHTRMVGIGRAHASQGLDNPTKCDLVRTVVRGIQRINGSAQRQVKPLLKNDVIAMLGCMKGTRGVRDRALLLMGFAAALRRSELVALRVEHIDFVREGMVVNLLKSKTDQLGEGRKIGVPLGRHGACPVKSLEHWLVVAGINGGLSSDLSTGRVRSLTHNCRHNPSRCSSRTMRIGSALGRGSSLVTACVRDW